jgi:hypothetical protein
MKKHTLVAVAALAAAAVPTAAVAQTGGTDKTAKATFQGPIKIVKGGAPKATLKVKYNCAKGETLWISAKQVESRKKDQRLTKEGSSAISASWLQSHRNKITCDGKKHTATFSMDVVENEFPPESPVQPPKVALKKGWAYVQWGITKPGEGEEGELTFSKNAFVKVK